MWERLRSIWTIPDLRNKILFTLGMLLVFRFLAQIMWYYWLLYFILAVAFTYFYAYIMWQQQNIPESLQKQGSFVPGYQPGKPTSKYLNAILNRVTLAGALFLGIVAILPYLSRVGGNQLLSSASLLIVVGVMLDTVRQLEAQMVMRNYSGFLT